MNEVALINIGLTGDEFSARVRAVSIDSQPWFVAADVCQALGIQNPTDTCRKVLGEDEYRVVKRSNLDLTTVPFPNRGANCLSESGLYKLIMRSDKPEAKVFQNWVTQVVLPAIRKDGGYVMSEEKVSRGEMTEDELVFKAISMIQEKIERRRVDKTAAPEIKALAPEAAMNDRHPTDKSN